MSEKTVLAYHFVGDTLRDGRPVPPDNQWLVHPDTPVIRRSGLHACRKPLDALLYAPGNTLCRVRLRTEIIEDNDKLVARERKILWRLDLEEALRAFARWCAIQVIDQWDAPKVVQDFLRTGDESLRDAARDSARAAARDSARAAAWDSARDAAWDAAWAAARAAARAAAWAAARDAQNKALIEFIAESLQGYNQWELTW